MITLTESAAERVRSYLERRGQGLGLRLSLKKTGCSGFAYEVDYADEERDRDVSFEDKGVRVLVDESQLSYLDGTRIDFVNQGLNQMFRFENPHVKGSCGCGESVSFEDVAG